MGCQRLIPTDYVAPLLMAAEREGSDIQQLVSEAGLDFNPLKSSKAIPAESFTQLYKTISRVHQGEAAELYSRYRMKPETFRALFKAIFSSPDLKSALINLRLGLMKETDNTEHPPLYRTEPESNVAYLVHHGYLEESHTIDSSKQLSITYSLALWHRFCCWLTDTPIQAANVKLIGPPLFSLSRYRFHFECPIKFEQPDNEITIQGNALTFPIVRTEQDFEALFAGELDSFFEGMDTPYHLTQKMRSLISSHPIEDIPKLPDVAEELSMPIRTLRRHLIKEGASYQKLKDEYRRDSAIELLTQPDISITSAAETMGFTEMSAFHRSFKKWTGITPGEFRQRNSIAP